MMNLAEAAGAIGASVRGQPVRFSSVSTDTRSLTEGALFVALRGERFDGHRFLDAASGRGAAAAMVEAGAATAPTGLPVLMVENTRVGLARLAAHWRSRFAVPMVAVAGSNGKTTVKEMIAAILRMQFGGEAALATEGNLNNEIGLPLTLLRLREVHRAAVVEIGINHPGETAVLAAIARPTVALVNNAQREHQEFMSSVEQVAREHGALYRALPKEGTAVINADDAYAEYWRSLVAPGQVRDFSIDGPAAVTGRYALAAFGSDIVLATPEGGATFTLQLAGVHSVRNAVAAAAAATAAGADPGAAGRGLAGFGAVRGRLQRKRGCGGAVVIDDTYNANPDSVLAAIDVLSRMPGRRILVLGDMGEVGPSGTLFHREIGLHAAAAGTDELFSLGDLASHAFAAYGGPGGSYARIEPLIAELAHRDDAGNTILVKGSRFMRMERIVDALTGETR